MIPHQLQKVAAIRRLLDAGGFPGEIEIDGGVKVGNAATCMAAGADVLVCGSSVFNAEASPAQNLAAIREALRHP
jgi:ribulose-phosphate 3-epimerase